MSFLKNLRNSVIRNKSFRNGDDYNIKNNSSETDANSMNSNSRIENVRNSISRFSTSTSRSSSSKSSIENYRKSSNRAQVSFKENHVSDSNDPAEGVIRSETFTIERHYEGELPENRESHENLKKTKETFTRTKERASMFSRFGTFTKKKKKKLEDAAEDRDVDDSESNLSSSYKRYPAPSEISASSDPFNILYEQGITKNNNSNTTNQKRKENIERNSVEYGTYRKSKTPPEILGTKQTKGLSETAKSNQSSSKTKQNQEDGHDKYRTVTLNSFRKSFRERFLKQKEVPYNPAWFVQVETPEEKTSSLKQPGKLAKSFTESGLNKKYADEGAAEAEYKKNVLKEKNVSSSNMAHKNQNKNRLSSHSEEFLCDSSTPTLTPTQSPKLSSPATQHRKATVKRNETFKIERENPESCIRIEIKNSITPKEPGRIVPVGVAKPMQSVISTKGVIVDDDDRDDGPLSNGDSYNEQRKRNTQASNQEEIRQQQKYQQQQQEERWQQISSHYPISSNDNGKHTKPSVPLQHSSGCTTNRNNSNFERTPSKRNQRNLYQTRIQIIDSNNFNSTEGRLLPENVTPSRRYTSANNSENINRKTENTISASRVKSSSTSLNNNSNRDNSTPYYQQQYFQQNSSTPSSSSPALFSPPDARRIYDSHQQYRPNSTTDIGRYISDNYLPLTSYELLTNIKQCPVNSSHDITSSASRVYGETFMKKKTNKGHEELAAQYKNPSPHVRQLPQQSVKISDGIVRDEYIHRYYYDNHPAYVDNYLDSAIRGGNRRKLNVHTPTFSSQQKMSTILNPHHHPTIYSKNTSGVASRSSQGSPATPAPGGNPKSNLKRSSLRTPWR